MINYKKTLFTVDVEPDLHNGKYLGITSGLKKFEALCDKYKIKPVLFVTSDCILRYSSTFKRLHKKGWEISFHGKTHKRFDEMSDFQKEEEIKSSVNLFKSKLGFSPKGFRAPQHSIDKSTLFFLNKYNFSYDSSYTPLNFLQLLFFPKKFRLWIKNFLSKRSIYQIEKNLREIPTSSFILPFVSLTARVLPKNILRAYTCLIRIFYEKPVFYAHSWDFIKIKDSKIDNYFSHELLLKRLEYLMKDENTRIN